MSLRIFSELLWRSRLLRKRPSEPG